MGHYLLKDPDHQLGLSIFVFNGVTVDNLTFSSDIEKNEILKIALNGGTSDLMQGEPSFARDLASLHGVSGSGFHQNLLNFPFDLDNPAVMDAIEQFQNSLSI